jgi:hypothetical protein
MYQNTKPDCEITLNLNWPNMFKILWQYLHALETPFPTGQCGWSIKLIT